MAVADNGLETLERVSITAENITTRNLSRLHDTDGSSFIVVFESTAVSGCESPKSIEFEAKVSSNPKLPTEIIEFYLSEGDKLQGHSPASFFESTKYDWVKQQKDKIHEGYQRSEKAFTAAYKGNIDQLYELIAQGIDLGWQDVNGDTPFTVMVKVNKFSDEVLKEFMQCHNANPFIVNKKGESALFHACRLNKTDVVECMLSLDLACIKYSVYTKTVLNMRLQAIRTLSKDMHTPLSLACKKSNTSLVKVLLENGAKPNLNRGSKNLPLFIAARRGDIELCELLLSYGATSNTEVPWIFGRSYPIADYLKNTPNNEMVKILFKYPPDLVPEAQYMNLQELLPDYKVCGEEDRDQAQNDYLADAEKRAKKMQSEAGIKFVKRETEKQKQQDLQPTEFADTSGLNTTGIGNDEL